MEIIDLSRELYHRTPQYPGQPPVIHGVWKSHEEAFADSGNVQGNSVHYFSMPDHGGTHIDAPRHFSVDGIPINEYPLEKCIVKGICVDLRHIEPKAEITPSDLDEAVKKTGLSIPEGGTVLLCTGHHERTFPTPAYSTDNPGVNVEATKWLAEQGVVHFGIDSMRPGPIGQVNALVHKVCHEVNITHLESLCNLEKIIGRGEFTFICLPMAWRGGTGSPVRAVAVFGL
jgi:kynurenine formamidase